MLERRPIPTECYTYTPITGRRDRNKNVWIGIVMAMMDPQKWGNKFFSSIIDIINKNSKGGVIAEKSAVDDPKDLEDNWASPDSVHWVNEGAISGSKIMPKPVGQVPVGLDKMMAFAMESVHEVIGISLEGMGQTNRDQSGVVEMQRRKQGITILAPYFDAMRKYRKEQGRCFLAVIDKFISDGRLIRIMGEDGKERYEPLQRSGGSAHYDIIVDESPTSPNQKEQVYGILQTMLQPLLAAGIPIPPELLDYAPIPSQLAEKWKALIEKKGKGDIPPQVKLGIAERDKALAKQGEEIKKLKDKRQETQAKMALDVQQAQQKDQQAQVEAQRKQTEMKAELELQMIKFRQEIQMEREKAKAQHALEVEKIENSLAVEFAKIAATREAKLNDDTRNSKNLVDDAIDQSLERVLAKPKRSVSFTRDDDGNIANATIEDVLEDMETAGNG